MNNLTLNNGQIATFLRVDDFSRPIYQLENGIEVCCTELNGTNLHTMTGSLNEPDTPLSAEYQPVPVSVEDDNSPKESGLKLRYIDDGDKKVGIEALKFLTHIFENFDTEFDAEILIDSTLHGYIATFVHNDSVAKQYERSGYGHIGMKTYTADITKINDLIDLFTDTFRWINNELSFTTVGFNNQ